ncbi:MAG: septum site-determining protein MinC [Sphingobacteriia bacterium]|nr:septum site-determining protein MinC [Sphingobacteriia bacterium]NCC40624.1 septum site-determining protein MinC [Gammaproteobacteria bacterium]
MTSHQGSNGGDRQPVFDLKAAGFTLPTIRLLDPDMRRVAAELGARVEKAPDFFRNTPIVIDLSALPEGGAGVEFPSLVGLLRGFGMIPFGVRGGGKSLQAAAEAMDLAILGEREMRGARPERPLELPDPTVQLAKLAPEPVAQEPNAAQGTNFTMITRPIRSGQRVYASAGDLCVIAPVSAGAELMAEGNIHVYGSLRGRALAGMRGNREARIFCQDLRAELVSIAGHYRVSENIPVELRGIPVQVFLDQKILRIEKL